MSEKIECKKHENHFFSADSSVRQTDGMWFWHFKKHIAFICLSITWVVSCGCEILENAVGKNLLTQVPNNSNENHIQFMLETILCTKRINFNGIKLANGSTHHIRGTFSSFFRFHHPLRCHNMPLMRPISCLTSFICYIWCAWCVVGKMRGRNIHTTHVSKLKSRKMNENKKNDDVIHIPS